jgi:hypothetical protein
MLKLMQRHLVHPLFLLPSLLRLLLQFLHILGLRLRLRSLHLLRSLLFFLFR